MWTKDLDQEPEVTEVKEIKVKEEATVSAASVKVEDSAQQPGTQETAETDSVTMPTDSAESVTIATDSGDPVAIATDGSGSMEIKTEPAETEAPPVSREEPENAERVREAETAERLREEPSGGPEAKRDAEGENVVKEEPGGVTEAPAGETPPGPGEQQPADAEPPAPDAGGDAQERGGGDAEKPPGASGTPATGEQVTWAAGHGCGPVTPNPHQAHPCIHTHQGHSAPKIGIRHAKGKVNRS